MWVNTSTHKVPCKNETSDFTPVPYFRNIWIGSNVLALVALGRTTSKTHLVFQHDLQTQRILPNHLTFVKDRGTLHCPRPWVSFEIWKWYCTFIFSLSTRSSSPCPFFCFCYGYFWLLGLKSEWLAAHPLEIHSKPLLSPKHRSTPCAVTAQLCRNPAAMETTVVEANSIGTAHWP